MWEIEQLKSQKKIIDKKKSVKVLRLKLHIQKVSTLTKNF